MLGTDKYAIDNKKLLSRLMPFFVRGRKLFGVLLASISPIESVHQAWREWALARIIESVATSQPIVMRWHLKKMLSPYMANSEDEFEIVYSGATYYIIIFEDETEQVSRKNISNYWVFEDEQDEQDMTGRKIDGVDINHIIYTRDMGETGTDDLDAQLTIVAPSHISSVSDSNYKRFVKQCVEKYLVYEMDYEIKVIGEAVGKEINNKQKIKI